MRRAAAGSKWSLVGALLLSLSACYSTGNSFRSVDLNELQPGVSTYQEVLLLLESDPVNTYYQTDGTYMARWAHTSSLLPDGIYFNRELWMNFDAQHRFMRIVKRHNVPLPEETNPDVEW